MKVNSITNKIYKNNVLKRSLEFASDKGALFVAGTQLAMSTVIRPFSIMATPKTEKENKKLACAKSISSSLVGYLLMLGVTKPISNGIEAIDKNPEKYLNPKSIKQMTEVGKPLVQSKSYKFATQLFKLGSGAIVAAPKAIMTCALIPPIMDFVMNIGKNKKIDNSELNNLPPAPKTVSQKKSNITFTGKENVLAKRMGKIIDSSTVQKMSEACKNSNYGIHMIALTDVVTTSTFIAHTEKSSKIKENRKKVLEYNAGISTGLSIACGYGIDKLSQKPTEKFIKKFSEVNKNDPKLSKYIEGIKIAKPILIAGGIYYILIPIISTFLADRINKKT